MAQSTTCSKCNRVVLVEHVDKDRRCSFCAEPETQTITKDDVGEISAEDLLGGGGLK